MTLSEQIDKFANETRDTVDIICRIAKRQGKEEALDIIEDIKAEIEHLDYLNIEDGSDGHDKYVDQYDVLQIIDKYTKGE